VALRFCDSSMNLAPAKMRFGCSRILRSSKGGGQKLACPMRAMLTRGQLKCMAKNANV
jgi:hypothetical protein